MQDANRAAIERFWRAMGSGDIEGAGAVYADDAVQEWPQSGERIVGRANIMAINENYPGLPTPTVRRIVGNGDLWVSEVTLQYGRDRYECVSVLEVRDGKIVREADYFAAPFEAPQWRAQWVEKS